MNTTATMRMLVPQIVTIAMATAIGRTGNVYVNCVESTSARNATTNQRRGRHCDNGKGVGCHSKCNTFWEEGGELETSCFSSWQKVAAWGITNSPEAKGI